MAEEIVVDIEFKTNVSKISKDLESVKDTLAETNESLEDIKKTGKGTETALGKIGKGFKGMGLAMKALGIGLVIEAFNFLKDIMMQNQGVIDAVSVATETAGVIFNQISSVISDVVDAVSKSSEGFEGLKAVMGSLLDVAVTPLKLSFYAIKLGIQSAMLAWEDSFLGGGDEGKIAQLTADIQETKDALKEVATDGLDAVKNIGENIGEAITEISSAVTIAADVGSKGIEEISVSGAIATGKALADAKKNEELLEVIRAKQQLQSQLQAEQQRQIRDDVTKTFQERIEANDKLGKILDEQLEKEQAIADEAVRIAKLELDTNSESVELQTAYQQALLEQIDIEERIAGQRSEQLTNEVALMQEKKDAQEELRLATMSDREQELEALAQDYAAKQELARLAGEEDYLITEQYETNLAALKDKFRQEDLDAAQKLADEQKKIDEAKAEQKAQIEQASFTLAKSLFAEGTNAYKAFALTEIGIDTARAVASLTANSEANPANAVSFGGAGILQFLSGMIRIVANIKKAKDLLSSKGKTPSAGGGGGGGGGSDAAVQASAEAANTSELIDLSNQPSLTEQFNADFTTETPVQAFVVEQDVTSSQQQATQIEQQSKL
jgi:hypothetical protein